MSELNVYEQIGGAATMRSLVNEFYKRVEADLELRAVFPAELEAGKEGQFLFLQQYFGGPSTYSEQRGHPRLRMRHNPFVIGQRERDLWLKYMLEAMDVVGIAEPARTIMQEYFERASTFMINQTTPGQLPLRNV